MAAQIELSELPLKSALHEALLDADIAKLEETILKSPDVILEGASPILLWLCEHEGIDESDHNLLLKLSKFKCGNATAFRQSEYIFLLRYSKFVPYFDLRDKFERLLPVQKLNHVRSLLSQIESTMGMSSVTSCIASLSDSGIREFTSAFSIVLLFDKSVETRVVKIVAEAVAFVKNGPQVLLALGEGQPASVDHIIAGIVQAVIKHAENTANDFIVQYSSGFYALSVRHVNTLLQQLVKYKVQSEACCAILFQWLPLEVPGWILSHCSPDQNDQLMNHWIWGSQGLRKEVKINIASTCLKRLAMMLEEIICDISKLNISSLEILISYMRACCFLCLQKEGSSSKSEQKCLLSLLHRTVASICSCDSFDISLLDHKGAGEVMLVTVVVLAYSYEDFVQEYTDVSTFFKQWHNWSTAPRYHFYLGLSCIHMHRFQSEGSSRLRAKETDQLMVYMSQVLSFDVIACGVSEALLRCLIQAGSSLEKLDEDSIWTPESMKLYLTLKSPSSLEDTPCLNAYAVSLSQFGCFSDGVSDLHDVIYQLLKPCNGGKSSTATLPSSAAVFLMDCYIDKCVSFDMSPLLPLELTQLMQEATSCCNPSQDIMLLLMYFALKCHDQLSKSCSPLPPCFNLLEPLPDFPIEECYQIILKSCDQKEDKAPLLPRKKLDSASFKFCTTMVDLISHYCPEMCASVYCRRGKRPLLQNDVHHSMAKAVWLTSKKSKTQPMNSTRLLKALLCLKNECLPSDEAWELLKSLLPRLTYPISKDDADDGALLVAEAWCAVLQYHGSRQRMVVDTINLLLKCQIPLSWFDLIREPLLLLSLPTVQLKKPGILSIILSSLDLLLVAAKQEGSNICDIDVIRSEQYVKSGSEMQPQVVNSSLRHLLLESMIVRCLLSLTREGCKQISDEVKSWIVIRTKKEPRLLQLLFYQGITFNDYLFVCSISSGSWKGSSPLSLLPDMLADDRVDIKLSALTLTAALSVSRRLPHTSTTQENVLTCINILVAYARSMQFRESNSVKVFKSSLEDLSQLVNSQPEDLHQSDEVQSQLKQLHVHADLVPRSISKLIRNN